MKVYICHDCKKKIIPPLGKPFGTGDGKTRCAGCAVDFYMKQPRAMIRLKPGETLYHATKS